MMKREAIVSLLLLVILALVQIGAGDRIPCAKRVFTGTPGINSFACVCNGTYCDTIEPVDTDDKQTTYQEYVTGRSDYRLEKLKSKLEPTASASSRLNITINRSKKFQTIIGFGGAITDAAAYNIYTLTPEVIDKLVKSYFDESGLQYNVIRVPVAGVDFSMREYTYDDVPNDFNLTQFQLGPEDVKWKIPFIQAAFNVTKRPLKLFASAWTAPPWMKTNNDYKGNGTLIGEPGGLYYQTWANYYLKFFQAFKSYGIDFWAMTAQNEPTDGDMYKFAFSCMGFTPQTQAIFVAKNLGPTLKQNGFEHIKIMILDDQRLFLPGWVEQAFAVSPDVRKYVDGIAVHWYMDSAIPAKLLDETHQEFPDKFIFGTEACAGAGPFLPHVILGGFDRAESYTKDIIQDLNHWVTGWTDWNVALDLRGGPNWANNFVDSPIIVNITSDEFYKQPMFYALGHFAKFIPEGSVRVDASASGDNLKGKVTFTTVNVESERRTVVVMLNEGNEDLPYSIYDPDAKQYINSVISAHSIKTINWFY